MSTAEAVNVAHAVGVRAWFLANRAGEPADLVDCIAGTIVKDNEEDRARLRRYFEQRVATHKEAPCRLIIKPATACREERCMSEPLIVGIRHHSPACAGW